MATVDKEVGSLPEATALNDDSLLVMEQNGEAMHFKGKVIKDWVEPYSTAAQNAYNGVKQALDNLPEGDTLIINDLTTGGVTSALSAEQGKVLKQNLDTHAQTLNSHASLHASGGPDPITPAMIGAVAAQGHITDGWNVDTLADGVYRYNGWAHANITHSVDLPFIQAAGIWIKKTAWNNTDNGERVDTVINCDTGDVYTMSFYNGTWKRTATTDYALARDGSNDMTGSLSIHNQGYVNLGVNSTEAMLTAWNDWNKRKFIHVPTDLAGSGFDTLQYVDMDTTEGKGGRFVILHTGNKPSGSYTGNGDATARTINTGGIGNALLIYGNGWSYIVTRHGAFGSGASGTNYTLKDTECRFVDGVLTLATTYNGVNENGKTFYYQVL